VFPGLTDSHLHLAFLADQLTAVDCETDALQECLERVQAKSASLGKEDWIIGYGLAPERWNPARYGTRLNWMWSAAGARSSLCQINPRLLGE
jgi:predicted amidohydrolase YtcJ